MDGKEPMHVFGTIVDTPLLDDSGAPLPDTADK
jgi:hypothetical protein